MFQCSAQILPQMDESTLITLTIIIKVAAVRAYASIELYRFNDVL